MRRPLVFLCGPAYQKDNPNDRRNIVKKYIDKNWCRIESGNYVHAIPVIVDDFIKPTEIRKAGLTIQINIIEEIISNISYRTYIFLDTMSTSYELGQFTNFAYNSEIVSVFIDKQYRNRFNNSIGVYIRESFRDKFIEYDASYNNQGHIFFPLVNTGTKIKRPIPESIIQQFLKDDPLLTGESFLYKLKFNSDFASIDNPASIVVEKHDNELVFSFSQKNLFYYVTSVYTNIRKDTLKDFPKSLNDERFKRFKDELSKELLTSYISCSNSDVNNSFILSNRFSMRIRCGDLNSDQLIYHMLYLSFMMRDYNNKSTLVIRSEDFYRVATEGIAFKDSEIDMLGVLNKHFNERLKNLLMKT